MFFDFTISKENSERSSYIYDIVYTFAHCKIKMNKENCILTYFVIVIAAYRLKLQPDLRPQGRGLPLDRRLGGLRGGVGRQLRTVHRLLDVQIFSFLKKIE